MSYILTKPYTEKQRADFVCQYQGLYCHETDKALYFLEENEIVDESGNIVVNTNYQKEKRLKEIEQELLFAKEIYNKNLDTPVLYDSTGFTYKPSYAKEDYESLLSSFDLLNLTSIRIEDSTHVDANVVIMGKQELLELLKFLRLKQISFWEDYTAKRSVLLDEKKLLIK